jgi:hypothetical protein
MPSSGMCRRVTLVRTDVSEEWIATIRAKRISDLGTALAATSKYHRSLTSILLSNPRLPPN